MITPMENLAKLQVGTVDFVAPDEIKVLLDLDAPQSIAMNTGRPRPFPRINGFVLVPTENGFIVGQVTWLAVEHSSFPKRKGMQDFGLIDLPFPLRKMSISLLGTLHNVGDEHVARYKFKRGVHNFPGLGDPVMVPDAQQLRAIVESGTSGKVLIGKCPLADNADVKVDPDRLFGRHLAVLGNTGSGKSCTVAGLIHWSLNAAREKSNAQLPNARFIVLDPNGEYSNAFRQHKARIFKVEPNESDDEFLLNVPAWIWNSTEWAAFTKASSKVQQPLLRRGLRAMRNEQLELSVDLEIEIKNYLSTILVTALHERSVGSPWSRFPFPKNFYEKLKTWRESIEELLSRLETDDERLSNLTNLLQQYCDNRSGQYSTHDATLAEISELIESIKEAHAAFGGNQEELLPKSEDAPIPFDKGVFITFLDALAKESRVEQFSDYLLVRIRTLLNDRKLVSVTGDQENISLAEWLEKYIGSGDAKNGNVTIVDLSLVPQEIVHILAAVIARMTFEALQRYRRQHSENKVLPTTLVMEEAHNFIKRYHDDSEEATASSVCCQVFEKIAREGRKFGLGLVLSSQRPSELSPTVLSQCNTFLLHRITNDKDQEMVARLLPDGLRGLIREIPALPSQHAFLVGWASELPILTRLLDLPEGMRPNSDDPDFWDVWTRTNKNGEDVQRSIDWPSIANEWQEFETMPQTQEVDSR
ncbi:ATP-binding protein [Methylobacter luteus]|uniref:ATP-binding protein n=1 Tax=Methylobacter luteus TaxID=415 RepID=UPI0004240246|nr:DUF87 domain-containing protein [Methylobacter luteus]